MGAIWNSDPRIRSDTYLTCHESQNGRPIVRADDIAGPNLQSFPSYLVFNFIFLLKCIEISY